MVKTQIWRCLQSPCMKVNQLSMCNRELGIPVVDQVIAPGCIFNLNGDFAMGWAHSGEALPFLSSLEKSKLHYWSRPTVKQRKTQPFIILYYTSCFTENEIKIILAILVWFCFVIFWTSFIHNTSCLSKWLGSLHSCVREYPDLPRSTVDSCYPV